MLLFRPELRGFGGAANPRFGVVVLSNRALRRPWPLLVALLAHEIAHIALRHGEGLSLAERVGALPVVRIAGALAIGTALALGNAPLTAAALLAWLTAEAGHRERLARAEEDADRAAHYLTGASVMAHWPEEGMRPRLTLREKLLRLAIGYPHHRPWLGDMAAAELVRLHGYLASRPDLMTR